MPDIDHDPFQWIRFYWMNSLRVFICPLCSALVFDGDTTKHERWHEAAGITGTQREVMRGTV